MKVLLLDTDTLGLKDTNADVVDTGDLLTLALLDTDTLGLYDNIAEVVSIGDLVTLELSDTIGDADGALETVLVTDNETLDDPDIVSIPETEGMLDTDADIELLVDPLDESLGLADTDIALDIVGIDVTDTLLVLVLLTEPLELILTDDVDETVEDGDPDKL